jgi:hypothetical protein
MAEENGFFEYLGRVGHAAAILISHTFLGGLWILCMWAVEHLIEALSHGGPMLVFGQWPLEYLFQTIDIAILMVIGACGIWETIGVLIGSRPR